MRKLIIAMTALAAAAPALAHPAPDPRDDDIVRRLPPPHEVERIGDAIGRATDALMDVDVGPIADALDPYHRRYDRRGRRETLGDLASRRDPYARERMRDEIGAVTVGLGAAVEQVAILTPVLRRSLDDATRRMEDAIARGRYDRRYDRYDPRDDRRYDPRDDEHPHDDHGPE